MNSDGTVWKRTDLRWQSDDPTCKTREQMSVERQWICIAWQWWRTVERRQDKEKSGQVEE